jgi:hypothetical protein
MRSIFDQMKCFVPLKWEDSLVLIVARFMNNVLSAVSLLTWIEFIFRYRKKSWHPWFVELWVFSLVALLFVSLFFGGPGNILIWWGAMYILTDAIGAAVRDIVASPIHHRDDEGGYIKVYDKTRWLLMAVVNVVQVVLCFAVFALHYGTQFNPHILEPSSAIYFSAVTFLTLGYGDILPCCPQTKALVSLELLIFLLFLVVKLPIALSVMRVKEERSY